MNANDFEIFMTEEKLRNMVTGGSPVSLDAPQKFLDVSDLEFIKVVNDEKLLFEQVSLHNAEYDDSISHFMNVFHSSLFASIVKTYGLNATTDHIRINTPHSKSMDLDWDESQQFKDSHTQLSNSLIKVSDKRIGVVFMAASDAKETYHVSVLITDNTKDVAFLVCSKDKTNGLHYIMQVVEIACEMEGFSLIQPENDEIAQLLDGIPNNGIQNMLYAYLRVCFPNASSRNILKAFCAEVKDIEMLEFFKMWLWEYCKESGVSAVYNKNKAYFHPKFKGVVSKGTMKEFRHLTQVLTNAESWDDIANATL